MTPGPPRSAINTPEEALVELARVLADESDPHAALADVCEIVRARTGSDGAKVYLAVPNAAGPYGAALIPVHRTNVQRRWEPAITVGDAGLSDWVYRNDDWLLVPQGVPAARTGLDAERALTGHHGVVHVLARPTASVLGGPPSGPENNEQSLLFVPMHRRDVVAGVLAVWRDQGRAYDPGRDVPALMQLSSHAVSACVAAARLEVARKELAAMNDLAERLTPSTRLHVAYDAVLDAAIHVAGAPAAILFHEDPDRPGHVGATRVRAQAGGMLSGVTALFRDLHVDVSANFSEWSGSIAKEIAARSSADGLVLRLQHLLPCWDRKSKASTAALAILTTPEHAPALLPSDNEQPLKSLLHYAAHALQAHTEVHAASLAGGMDFRGGPKDLPGMLQVLATQVEEAVSGDVALVFLEDWDGWKLWSWSEGGSVPNVVIRSESAMFRLIEKNRVFRVSYAEDTPSGKAPSADLSDLAQVVRTLGWSGVQSLIGWRVVFGDRRLGAILILTRGGGEVLGSLHADLGKSLLERASATIERLGRRFLLEDLNRLATELASLSGDDLRAAMPRALRGWTGRFLRPGCEVAVIARLRDDRALLSGRSSEVDEGLMPRLERLSIDLAEAEVQHEGTHPSLDMEDAYAAAPIRLPESPLAGHIFVFHPSRFREGDLEILREAAREMSVVLNGERYRQEFTLSAGLFRHALIGPVQGLTQAARMLVVSARSAGAKDVERLRARIDEEAEIISLWRENQRLYMGGHVEARPRSQALRPVVERCVERYLSVLLARNIVAMTDWKLRGTVVFPFDADALDLAISNLLDNARKYSFFNRPVSVGVAVRGPFVQIWVENVGHAIPEGKELYQVGKRSNLTDPFRIIGGEGLGLAMVNAVVAAHGGRLSHTCKREGELAGLSTTPYRVRFTIELPHYWKKETRARHEH